MNCPRKGHGIGVVTINGEDRVAVFGGRNGQGYELDCGELHNTKTEKWEPTSIKLNEPKDDFGFFTMK